MAQWFVVKCTYFFKQKTVISCGVREPPDATENDEYNFIAFRNNHLVIDQAHLANCSNRGF